MHAILFLAVSLLVILGEMSLQSQAFQPLRSNFVKAKTASNNVISSPSTTTKLTRSHLQMNFFGDAVRFFSNLNKEASAKHILIKGADASEKLKVIKEEIESAPDVSVAFSELAKKVSQCPSAARGGNLGTFKPGMMVAEFDKVVFEEEVGKVHGPVQTQFGAHLILITRRFEGDNKEKS